VNTLNLVTPFTAMHAFQKAYCTSQDLDLRLINAYISVTLARRVDTPYVSIEFTSLPYISLKRGHWIYVVGKLFVSVPIQPKYFHKICK